MTTTIMIDVQNLAAGKRVVVSRIDAAGKWPVASLDNTGPMHDLVLHDGAYVVVEEYSLPEASSSS